jgi:hypothetical protein
MSAATEIEATMLLCDSAQSVGGKLFILGGGWSLIKKTDQPMSMALAVKLSIPWSRTNERHRIEAQLETDQGVSVSHEGQDVRADGEIEVGRPPGLKPGTALDAAFVLTFQGLALEPGGYVWVLRAGDDAVLARAPFQVLS